ncbi:MAG: hypothetical protein JWN90_244 [Parcubacteria group bacterium]|nr:hypothetical protein [Parcubacteria group bacterium]
MKIEKITEPYLGRVLVLYEEVIGGDISLLPSLRLLHDIETRTAFRDGYRLDSRWDAHSKLELRLDCEGNVIISFFENFDRKEQLAESPRYVEAVAAGIEFEVRIRELE